MLYNLTNLTGAALTATDGAIGEVEEFYFDDERWTVRYLVVNTGGKWFNKHQVLLSPYVVERIDPPTNQIFVRLTQVQVEHSPDVDTQQPVARLHEAALARYYNYPYYWGGANMWGTGLAPVVIPLPEEEQREALLAHAEAEESHLRSTKVVTGYYLQAVDDDLGHLADFLLDETSWALRYLVVDTRNWWPGNHVLLAPQWVTQVSWSEHKVFVNLTHEMIQSSPAYTTGQLVTQADEEALHAHYRQLRGA